MNHSQQLFMSTGGAPGKTGKLLECLQSAKGQWVSLLELVGAGTGYAAHSRASDARKLGYKIENKVVFDPLTKQRESYYRLLS